MQCSAIIENHHRSLLFLLLKDYYIHGQVREIAALFKLFTYFAKVCHLWAIYNCIHSIQFISMNLVKTPSLQKWLITWIHSTATIIGKIRHKDEGPQIWLKIANTCMLYTYLNFQVGVQKILRQRQSEFFIVAVDLRWFALIWPLTSILTPALWANEGFFTKYLTQISISNHL